MNIHKNQDEGNILEIKIFNFRCYLGEGKNTRRLHFSSRNNLKWKKKK